MKQRVTTRLAVIGVMCLTGILAVNAEQEERLRPSKEEVWIGRSDLVADVEVVGNEVVYALKSLGDKGRSEMLGDLITLRVRKHLFQRAKKDSNQTGRIYIYKRGKGITDPFLHTGDVGVIFLRKVRSPDLLTTNQVTWPKLPPDNYYDYAVLPNVRGPDRTAFIPQSNTNEISAFERQIRNRPTSNMRSVIPDREIEPFETRTYTMRAGRLFTNISYRTPQRDSDTTSRYSTNGTSSKE